ncbi:hypothetical protein, conserved [Leishmania donovani]|uniref:WD domain, G-beta repeat family protein n=1 Tax=Leishmania donovani TaxID=5661 RepID=E9BSB5_LEIDO|nr:hypothetical protein, conserved [Leishmania donovani]TPP44511.1 WD domain, G-beta repeat family protein [Leishmania donovani]CBZ38144.1 hypothetical protein, conserved [Leishmania donovani]
MHSVSVAAASHVTAVNSALARGAEASSVDDPSMANKFEACCRALSHKVNKAVVEQLPALQNGSVVDLSHNYVGAAGLQAIAVILQHNPNVTEVRAPRNGLTNDAVVLFCRAMRGHQQLSALDLSDNPDVSLAGGLALVNLAQQTPSLRVVKLNGTHVLAAVLDKLTRALEYNASHHGTTSPGVVAALSTAAVVASSSTSPSSAAVAMADEARTLQTLRARVEAALEEGYLIPPASPQTGWRVLDVPILAPPLLFDNEVRLLCNEVFPRLNQEFASHRVILCPVVVGGGAGAVEGDDKVSDSAVWRRPHRTAGSYNRALHFRPVSDVTSIVERGRFVTIELVGDLPGDYAQLAASAMLRLQGIPQSTPQRVESHDDDEPEEAAAPLQPVLYEAHEAALRYTRWLLVATRRDTRTLKVPAALAPLLTADPIIAHPDRHRSVVRTIFVADEGPSPTAAGPAKVAEGSRTGATSASGAIPTSLEWDYATEEYQWRRHVDWREHVVATAPVAELVIPQYTATFDCIDAQGGVRLKHLDGFQMAVYARLRTVLEACVAAEARKREAREAAESDAGAKSLSRLLRSIGTQRARDTTYIQALAAASSGAAKKNLMNRMIIYAANPPSRNMLLLHGTDAASLASLMARGAARLQTLQHAYTLAVYTARSALLHEEPTELRSVMTHVVSQLTKDAAVLRYVNAEVEIERLSAFFLQVISGSLASKNVGRPPHASAATTAAARAMCEAGLPGYVAQYTLNTDEEASAGNTASAHAFVVLLDGLEELAMPVQPCGALVHPPGSSGNIAGGGGAEPSSWLTERTAQMSFSAAPSGVTSKTQSKPRKTPMDWLLPRALARYVRLIASCLSNSAAFSSFDHLGRDSVDMLSFGAVSANEVEQYLSPASLARAGLVLSEDEYECARSKRDAPIAEYMNYLLDAARNVHEAPGFLTQLQVIQTFPDTLQEAAQGVYDRLVHTFGLPVTCHVLGLLMASRWGLLLPELRDLLPSLSMCRLQELLRLLRPALEQEAPVAAAEMMGVGSGNVLLGAVRLTAPSFLEVVQRESLKRVADELQAENDQRVWHTQLAQYYLSIVYRWLQPGAAADAVPAKVRRVNDASAAEAYVRPETQALHRRAMKEVIYHMTQSGDFWSRMDVTILSVPFMEQVYEFGLGYAYLRDLTAAFNERYQRHLLGEDIGEPSWQQHPLATENDGAEIAAVAADEAQASSTPASVESSRYALPAVLIRMRDYICFARQYGLLLSLHPTLVAQVALQIPASLLNSVQRDAVTFLCRQLQDNGGFGGSRASLSRVFFSMTPAAAKTEGKQPIHLRPITCAAFLPNRLFVVTASSDRSLAWVNPESGKVAWYARQPTAAVESLTVCRTSAYVAAVSEDRTVWVYDGLQGTLVSQCRGSKWFDAPIASLTFSARGRYLWVVTTDARVRCFACESGQLRCTMSLSKLLQVCVDEASANGEKTQLVGAGATAAEEGMPLASGEWRHRRHYLHVLVDAEDDEVCTTVVATELRQWRLRPWDELLPATEEVGQPAHKSTTLIACEMTMRCSLSKAPASASDGPLGYKFMKLWEPASVRPPHMCILAAPHTEPEVQLFTLEHTTGNPRLVVRFPLVASSSSDSGAAPAAQEVSLMCTSPDGRWVAVGLIGGAVSLFCIGAAYHASQRQQQHQAGGALVCRPTCVYTSLMPTPGMSAAPLRSLTFHRDGLFLFALGNCLACWRLPDAASVTLQTDAAEAVRSTADGQYLCSHTPTCLAVLPPPTPCKSDAELPRNIAEVAVGDDTGHVTLLTLWRQLI